MLHDANKCDMGCGSAISFAHKTLMWRMAMTASCCPMYHQVKTTQSQLGDVQILPVQLGNGRGLSPDAAVCIPQKASASAGMKGSSNSLCMIQLVTHCATWHLLHM